MKNSTRSTFVVKILAIGLTASAFLFQAQSAFADDEDFGYGFDAADLVSPPGEATQVYMSELETGVGNLDESDTVDTYKFTTPSSEFVTVYLYFPEGGSNPIYAQIYDSEGLWVDNLYVESSYDYYTIQYRPNELFYVVVTAGSADATYGLTFSGLD